MLNKDPIDKIVKNRNLEKPPGIFSICSANPYVLRASMQTAKKNNLPLLIESTCNQVNQFGGYMNLKPSGYVRYIETIARETDFPMDQILLGGDHLGPSVWKNEPAASAMQKSIELVRAYIRGGFRKIHLDTSMPCLDDPSPLPKEIIAEREAQLCKVAVEENRMAGNEISNLTFVVGTEVPPPGGSFKDKDKVNVSSVKETEENISSIKKAFEKNDLEAAWERVRAFVVQPGVEFSDSHIHAYDREKARDLSRLLEKYENLIYEAHSTDYQTRSSLQQMVADHFAILKVGPALTFALREALFSLEEIEKEIFHGKTFAFSNLKAVLDNAMISNPQFWKKYYSDDSQVQFIQRRYSLLDRSRYYLNTPDVDKAIRVLISNLSEKEIPLSLVSQYFPDQVEKIREGYIESNPLGLINGRVEDIINRYVVACSEGAVLLEAAPVY
jgi:D-tagatose-1,6-bisphosphate aldolase subunit GatZ/KbaZ